MNKEAAQAILGLNGDENRDGVTQTYSERLASVQEQIESAQSDTERNAHGARLAELSQAYELVTGTGRYTISNEEAGTLLRSGSIMSPASGDAFVRMEQGAVIADRLEIGVVLGEGGMGRVYAARDRLKEEDVAIKVLRHDLQFSTAAKDRFLGEARVSCNLSHPNIVRVHDVGIIGGTYYLSMERLKGHTLRQLMDQYRKERRVFRIAEVTDIARQLIDALRYAHRYIIHRDIKPENIWLTEDGTVKLMDFGIARAFSNSQMTQTGMMLGTAYYMSPEQRADSKNLDWRTDQYALGVVLYEMLTGTLPTGGMQPIDQIRRDLPQRYTAALMRAMAPLPKKRFKSLDDMLVELQAPKSYRLFRLLLITVALAAVYVNLNDRGWISNPSAAVAALKAELAAASARLAESLAPPKPVQPPLPEVTPPAASAEPQPELVQESIPEPVPESAELQPAESEAGALESTAIESGALDPAASETQPQIPAESNADAVGAASVPETSQQGEASATTQSPSEPTSVDFEAKRNQCIAQCETDVCSDKADAVCVDKLRVCREACG